MRLRLLIIFSLCLSINYKEASTWTPCMPFCDTMCTGAAAVELSANVASQYSSLSAQVLANTASISNLASVITEQQASLYSEGHQVTQKRLTAYDGVAKTITASLEVSNKTHERIVDHISQELLIMKRNLRMGELTNSTAKRSAMLQLAALDNSLTAIPALGDELAKSEKRAKEATQYQFLMSNAVTKDSAGNQIQVMLNNVDFDIPNPFSVQSIDEKHWKSYQDRLMVSFNTKHIDKMDTLLEKREYLKRQIAMAAISESLSEMVKIPDENSKSLAHLSGEPNVTLNHALFEQFKQEMMDINVQSNTKAVPVDALRAILVLNLAQKNLLLSEINKTKKLKNSLLAISEL